MVTHVTDVQQLVWPTAPTKRQWYRRREQYKSQTTSERHSPQPYTLYETFTNRVYFGGGTSTNHATQDPSCENMGLNRYLTYADRGAGPIAPYEGLAWNRCRARFKERVHGGVSAALGAAVAECGETLAMISNRAIQLYHMARSLKRGDIRGFVANLSSSDAKRTRRQYSKFRNGTADLSSVWLEAWFGWAPSVGDIYDGYRVLTRDFGSHRVHSSGSSRASDLKVDNTTFQTTTARWLYINYKMYGRFKITNPNLLLASELGLTNPLSVLWEVTPFSFLVDWFTSFGDWVENLNDQVGWDLYPDSFFKRIAIAEQDWFYHPTDHRFDEKHKTFGKGFDRVKTAGYLPGVTLQFNRIDGLSITRAATSIALLVGALQSVESTPRIPRI